MKQRLVLVIPLILFLGLAVLFYKSLGADKETLPSALLGKAFPAFSLPSLTDQQQVLDRSALVGQPALVNVWATWCISCRVEHPVLNQLAQAGVRIIGLNYKDHRGKALRWLQDLGDPYEFNIYDQEGRLGLDLGVYGAPETYLVDKSGQIRYKHVGVVDFAVWRNTLAPLYEELSAEAL